jgi:hypothetical protein
MKATNGVGKLEKIKDCYLQSSQEANGKLYASDEPMKMYFDNIPDISDKKSAKYNDETGIGRTAPIKAYANSENRNISVECHFFVQEKSGSRSAKAILTTLRWLEAHVYPRDDPAPYAPPPIMQIKCKKILSELPLCVVLLDYNVKFDSSVPWDEETGIPYKVDVSLNFEAVYNSSDLPYAKDITINGGK